MTVRTGTATRTFTEAELEALAIRFAILSRHGHRHHYVDGVEVSEAEYRRAFDAAHAAPAIAD